MIQKISTLPTLSHEITTDLIFCCANNEREQNLQNIYIKHIIYNAMYRYIKLEGKESHSKNVHKLNKIIDPKK